MSVAPCSRAARWAVLVVALGCVLLAGCRRRYRHVDSFVLTPGGGCAALDPGPQVFCWGSESRDATIKPVAEPGVDMRDLAAKSKATDRFWLDGKTVCDRHAPEACEVLAEAPQSFASGPTHACYVLPGGRVECRGEAGSGRLGEDNTTFAERGVQVKWLPPASAVAVGDDFACALLVDETVYCWGANAEHQLAQAELRDHPRPRPLRGLYALTGIGARGKQACASLLDGGLRCWGSVPQGGSIGRPSQSSSVPMAVLFP